MEFLDSLSRQSPSIATGGERSCIEKIPVDALSHIFDHLTPYDLLQRFGLTSKLCNNAVKQFFMTVTTLTMDDYRTESECNSIKQNFCLNLAILKLNHCSLAFICQLTNLKNLSFDAANITDVELKHFSRLTGLTSLKLYGSDISDNGLGYLTTLTNLSHLDLYMTKITDACIPDLICISSLQSLDLRLTSITWEGKEALSAALPDMVSFW